MDFLRRLSPWNTDAIVAKPLITARFSEQAPLRQVSRDPDHDQRPDDDHQALSAVAEPSAGAGTQHHPQQTRAAMTDAAPLQHAPDVARGRTSPGGGTPVRPDTSASLSSERGVRPDLRAARHPAGITTDAPVHPHGEHSTTMIGVPKTARDPFLSQAPRPIPAVFRPSPIREHVVARAEPRTAARTQVHVTIDRIDVRVPRTPPEAARPRAKSVSTPSVSLTDYLRSGSGDRR